MPPTKKKTTGIFRTLPKKLVKQEKADAIKFQRALDSVATAAYENFFSLPVEFREEKITKFPVKKMGRKVK